MEGKEEKRTGYEGPAVPKTPRNKKRQKSRKKAKETEYVKGIQATPAEFTRYMERIHAHKDYEGIKMRAFRVEEEMRLLIGKAVREARGNKAIGSDVVHAEMLMAASALSSDLLTSWWSAVGRTEVFPDERSEGVICPLFKKGSQREPANYRPECLLSHVRKIVDPAVL